MKISILFIISLIWTSLSFANESSFYLNHFDGNPSYRVGPYQIASRNLIEANVLAEFDSFMEEKKMPSTSEFMDHLDSQIEAYCKRGSNISSRCLFAYRKNVIDLLRYKNRIDNMFYLIIEDQIKFKKANLMDLKTYLSSLRSIYFYRKNKSPETVDLIQDTSFLNTKELSRSYSGYKGLLPRQVLYMKYNAYQIKLLSRIFEETLEIMNSPEAYIFIRMDSDQFEDIKLELSPTEKYRLGLRLLKHKLAKLPFKSNFSERPQFIDVLSSALDTGLIPVVLLGKMVRMTDYKDAYRNRFKIYVDVLKEMGKTLVINTPIVGQLALLPILVLETKKQIETSRQEGADETHLF